MLEKTGQSMLDLPKNKDCRTLKKLCCITDTGGKFESDTTKSTYVFYDFRVSHMACVMCKDV